MSKIIKLLLVANGLLWSFSCTAFSADGSSTGVIGSSTGRYVLGQLNQLARDQFLLDTQTGRLWHLSVYNDSKNVALYPVPYVTEESDEVIENIPDFTYLPSPSATTVPLNKTRKK